MSFRIEEKLFVKRENLIDFKKFLEKKSVKQIYHPRIIKSLYFDNINLDMYADSKEGLTPRKKIRLRTYPKEEDKKIYLEVKNSSVEGRFKTSDWLSDEDRQKIKSFGYFDNLYGNLEEILNVTYLRKYYLFSEMRITLDTNIIYRDLKHNLVEKKEGLSVLEIKASEEIRIDLIKSLINEKTQRFSKYCNGIKALYSQFV